MRHVVTGVLLALLLSLVWASDVPRPRPWYEPRDAAEAALLARWGEGDLGMHKLAEHRGEGWRNAD